MVKKKVKPNKRRVIDWEAIEKEYRLGQKSMGAIAEQFGVNKSNISRHAKKENWVQDKSEEIRQRTNATLVAQQENNTPTREDIDVAVRTNVEVIRGHRRDIANGRRMVDLLFTHLHESATNRTEIEETIIEETPPDEDGKIDFKKRNAMLKAVSLPAHAGVLRDLSTTLKNLIPLERNAFNLDDGDKDKGDIHDLLDNVAGSTRGLPNRTQPKIRE